MFNLLCINKRSLSKLDKDYSLEDVHLQRVEPTLHPRADINLMQPVQLELVGHSIVRMLQFKNTRKCRLSVTLEYLQ